MVRSVAVALSFALLVALAPAAAASSPPSPLEAFEPARRTAALWAAGADSVTTAPSSARASDGGERMVQLYPLGDANGDGHGDLLALRVEISLGDGEDDIGFAAQLSAISGADLKTSLWDHRLDDGMLALPVADADGDGAMDLAAFDVMLMAGISGSSPGVPIPFVSAGQYEFTGGTNATLHSGRDFSPLARLAGTFSAQGTGAGAYPLVLYAGADQGTFTFRGTMLLEPGLLIEDEVAGEQACAYAFAAVAFGGACTFEADLYVRVTTLSGESKTQVRRDSDGLVAVARQAAELTGSGGRDILVLEAKPTLPVFPMLPGASSAASPAPVIAAHDGASGAELWTVERDPVDVYAGLLPALGDLTGDGKAEVGLVEAWTPTGDLDGEVRIRTSVLSGADGSQLGAAEGGDTWTVLLPFGDSDADGKAELLRLDLALSDDSFTASLAGPDLEPRWTLDAEGTMPLNLVIDPFLGEPSGFTDLGGDGAPDIALLILPERGPEVMVAPSEGSPSPREEPPLAVDTTLRVVDGATGTVAWEREVPGLMDVQMLPRAGAPDDLLAVRIDVPTDGEPGLEDATLLYEILDGATGDVVRSQVLRGPAHEPLPGSGFVQAMGIPVGDLDADGATDIGVWVTVVREGRIATPYGGEPATSKVEQAWLLFSGADGHALGQLSNAAALAEPLEGEPLEVLPASDYQAPREAGALPIALAAVALAAAGLRRRR